MGTWLKKISYSTVTKIIAIILLCVATAGTVQSSIDVINGMQYEAYRDSYVETQDFFWDILLPKAGYVRDWIVRYTDEDVFDESKVDIVTYQPNYASEYRKLKDKGLSEEDYKEEITRLENRIRSEVIRDRKIHFAAIENNLINEPMNLDFFAYDIVTKEVVTNMTNYDGKNKDEIIKSLKGRPAYVVGDETTISYKGSTYSDISSYYTSGNVVKDKNHPYEIYVAVKENLEMKDDIYHKSIKFNVAKNHFNEGVDRLAICIVVTLVMLIYLTIVTGRKITSDTIVLNGIDNIPFEIQGILLCIVGFILVACAAYMFSIILDEEYTNYYSVSRKILNVLGIGGMLLVLSCYLSMVRHLKNRSFWKNTLIGKVFYLCIENIFDNKRLPIGILMGTGFYVLINGILYNMIFNSYSTFIVLIGMVGIVGINITIVLVLFKIANDFRTMGMGIKRIEAGDLNYKIHLTHTLPAMKDMASTMNHIGDGLANSIDKVLRSEKMKTELITNVSHDLKTPLTSIISYIDLLKDEEIESEAAREYIEVISERGERLKVLIQDLVEASKAATGNIAVNLEEIELGQFIQQAVGEYTDRLDAADITIVMNEEDSIKVEADGRHMWRIVENLLTNVVKYAMPHTRVYIDVYAKNETGIVSIKNISREQLNGKEKILTERFVRGDEARSTEGSGLGLAIAESLTELQGGKLSIEIDGDLFKIMVQIPLSKKEEM